MYFSVYAKKSCFAFNYSDFGNWFDKLKLNIQIPDD